MLEESSIGIANKLSLEIVGIKLTKKSWVVQDGDVKFLFVDYHGFLDLPPYEVETPQSLPKPKAETLLAFNFTKGNLKFETS